MPGVADNQKPNGKGREGLKLVLASPSGEELGAIATVTVPTYPDPTSVNERVLWITDFDSDYIRSVCDQILMLAAKDPATDITLVIMSPGGSAHGLLGLYDAMDYVPCDVRTVAIGRAMSAGAYLLAHGTKGKRAIFPRATVMVHELQVGIYGSASDVENEAKEAKRISDLLIQVLADDTGKAVDAIKAALNDESREDYLDAAGALAIGIVDSIVENALDLLPVQPAAPAAPAPVEGATDGQ